MSNQETEIERLHVEVARLLHDRDAWERTAREHIAALGKVRDELAGLLGYLGILAHGQTVCGQRHEVARRYVEAVERSIGLPTRTGPRLVLVESPYAGNVVENVEYLRACLRDCLMRGEAPFASHGLYTLPGVLDDGKPGERALGIAAGLAWGRRADATVVYTDRGVSPGMREGIEAAQREGRPVEYRTLGKEWL